MLRQRSVTGFAIHAPMLATLLLIKNICMASFTTLVPRKPHRTGSNLRHCIRAVMSTLSEALRNQKASDHEKYQ